MKCLFYIFVVCFLHGFVATKHLNDDYVFNKHLNDDYAFNHPDTGQNTNYRSTQYIRHSGHSSHNPMTYVKQSLRHSKTIDEPTVPVQEQYKHENLTKEVLNDHSENDKEIRRLLLNKIHQSTSHKQEKKSQIVYKNYSFEHKLYDDDDDDGFYYGDYSAVPKEHHRQDNKTKESHKTFIDGTRASKDASFILNDNQFLNESTGGYRTEAGYTHDRDICKQYNENLLKYWNQLNKITTINAKQPSQKSLHNIALIIEAYLQHQDARVEQDKLETFDSETQEHKKDTDHLSTVETIAYDNDARKLIQDFKRKKLSNILDNILLELNLSFSLARARSLNLDKIIHIVVSNLQYKTNLETDKRCRKAKIKTLVEYVQSAYNAYLLNSQCLYNTDTEDHLTKLRTNKYSSTPNDPSHELAVAYNYFGSNSGSNENNKEAVENKLVTSDNNYRDSKMQKSEEYVTNNKPNQHRTILEDNFYNEVDKLFDVSQQKDTKTCRKIAANWFLGKVKQMVTNYIYDVKCEDANITGTEIIMEKPDLIFNNLKKIQIDKVNSERSRNNSEKVTSEHILEDIVITLEDISTLLFSQDDASVNSLKPSLHMIIDVLKNKLKYDKSLQKESIIKETSNTVVDEVSNDSKPEINTETNKYIQMFIELLNNSSTKSSPGTSPSSTRTFTLTTSSPVTDKQHNSGVNTNDIDQKQYFEKLFILPLLKNVSESQPNVGRRENHENQSLDINWFLQLIHYAQQNPDILDDLTNEYEAINTKENKKPDLQKLLRDGDLKEIVRNINNPNYEWFVHFVEFIKETRPDFIEKMLKHSKNDNNNEDQTIITTSTTLAVNNKTPLSKIVELQSLSTKLPTDLGTSTINTTPQKVETVTVNNIYATTTTQSFTEGNPSNTNEDKTKLIADLLFDIHKLYEVPDLRSETEETTSKDEVLTKVTTTHKPTESSILHTTESYKPHHTVEKLNSHQNTKDVTDQLLIEIAKVINHNSDLVSTTGSNPITNDENTTYKPLDEITESVRKLTSAPLLIQTSEKSKTVDALNKIPEITNYSDLTVAPTRIENHNENVINHTTEKTVNEISESIRKLISAPSIIHTTEQSNTATTNDNSNNENYQLLVEIAKKFTNYSDLIATTAPTISKHVSNDHTTDKNISDISESLRKLILAPSIIHTTEKPKADNDLNTTDANEQPNKEKYQLLVEIAKVFTNYSDFVTTISPITKINSEKVPSLHTTEKYKTADEINSKPGSDKQIQDDTRQLFVDIAKVITQYSDLAISTESTTVYSQNDHTTNKPMNDITTEHYKPLEESSQKPSIKESPKDNTNQLIVEISKVLNLYNDLVASTLPTPTTRKNTYLNEETVRTDITTVMPKEHKIATVEQLIKEIQVTKENVKPNKNLTKENVQKSTAPISQSETDLQLLIDLLRSLQRPPDTKNIINTETHHETNVFHKIEGQRNPTDNKTMVIVNTIKQQADYSDVINILKAILDTYSKKQVDNKNERTFNVTLLPSDNYDTFIHQLYETITNTEHDNHTKTEKQPLSLNDDIISLLIQLLKTDKEGHKHSANKDTLTEIINILVDLLKEKDAGPEGIPKVHNFIHSTERPVTKNPNTVNEIHELNTILTSYSNNKHEDHPNSHIPELTAKEQPYENFNLNYDYGIGNQDNLQMTEDQIQFLEDLERIKAHLKQKADVVVPMNNQGPHLKTEISLTPQLHLNPYEFEKYDLRESETSHDMAKDQPLDFPSELYENPELLKNLQVSQDYVLGDEGNVEEGFSNNVYIKNITNIHREGKKDVELTYLLKQPRFLIYQPHVLVKQRVPYDFYVKNIENKLKSSLPIVNNTAKLVKVVKYDEAKPKLLYETKIPPKQPNIIEIDADTHESNSTSSQELNEKEEILSPLHLFNVGLNKTGLTQRTLNTSANQQTMTEHTNYTEIKKHVTAEKSNTNDNKGSNSFVHHINTTVYHKASKAKPINITVIKSETKNLSAIHPNVTGTKHNDFKINNTKLVFDVLTNQTVPPLFHTIEVVKDEALDEPEDSFEKVKGLEKH